MNHLEQALQELFPEYHALTTSRGSTALYLALKAIAEERGYGEVVVPSTVCPSVPLTVALAGFQPRFCDVDLETLCVSSETIAPHLSDRTKAVVVVYLFGKSPNLGRILELVSRRDLFVIEDIAQAVGGEHEGRPLGSFGDFSLLSFDDSKIVKGSSGALLIRERRFMDGVIRHQNTLYPMVDTHALQELKRGFRDFTMGLFDLLRSEDLNEPTDLASQILEKFRRLFIHQRTLSGEEMEPVLHNLSALKEERERRFRNYLTYVRHLRPDVKHVSFGPAEMCWRLPILANNHQQQLLIIERIRSEGGLVSNHFFPASFAFGELGGDNARQIGLRAVNLWVDSKVNENDILRNCRVINEIAA